HHPSLACRQMGGWKSPDCGERGGAAVARKPRLSPALMTFRLQVDYSAALQAWTRSSTAIADRLLRRSYLPAACANGVAHRAKRAVRKRSSVRNVRCLASARSSFQRGGLL